MGETPVESRPSNAARLQKTVPLPGLFLSLGVCLWLSRQEQDAPGSAPSLESFTVLVAVLVQGEVIKFAENCNGIISAANDSVGSRVSVSVIV